MLVNPISDSYNLLADSPEDLAGFVQEGTASWYGPGFHGRRTASGEIFNTNELTAAHKTLPFFTFVKVTNLSNDKQVIVKINDRGPYIGGRIIDLSKAAKEEIGMGGLAQVRIEIYNPEKELSGFENFGESEIEGFRPENLFEDVISKQYNELKQSYTFKKVKVKILSPNIDEANSNIYRKHFQENIFNSSELPDEYISGYTLKIVKTSGHYDTKELIGELESLGYENIFLQVIPKKDSTIFYVMVGVFNDKDTANEVKKVLESNGYTIKLEKFVNHH
ncbi:MAG: septal ring lytic transglycosylase RlpA family protein [Ignavibacteria bacterium]|nr:septal ring lytic transglycosylase RlpA family protein [Ignavibacteria bacterium]